jgi:uncharacterized Zn finger protein
MPTFSEADIRAGASAQSYSRGVSYQRDGAVLALAQRDNVITAEVTGSDYDPYDVEIHLDATGAIHSAGCSCPYEQGGYCKHIVAVLLAVLENSEDIAVHPGVASLLAGLGEAELRQLILNVAQDEPGFADAIERGVSLLRKTGEGTVAPTGSAPAPAVDVAAVRRDLRRSFRLATQRGDGGHHHGYYDYDEGEYIDADDILQPHLAAARAFLAGGHPAAAAELLAAAIDEWGECVTDLEEWVYEASEDSIEQAASSVDFLLAECLLSQPLSPAERRGWEERLGAWAEDAMQLAITELALETWWDDPWLQAALQGQIFEPVDATAADDLAEEIEDDSEEEDKEDLEDDEQNDVQVLTPVWLSILERAGRTQEYLNLALAADETVPYLLKLVAIGAVEQAVAVALARPLDAAASLNVAKALAQQQRRPEALAVAAHGLAAPSTYATGELAAWLAPLAEHAGEHELALRAARIAFLNRLTLADYQVVARVAGPSWPAVKGELLAALKIAHSYQAMDIYLYEQMLPEAIALVDNRSYYGDVAPVVAATGGDYPDWAIRQCKRHAEPIMNGGKAAAYADAAAWLRRAREIYAQHGRLAEWDPYLEGLLATHGRKYKLVPLLRVLE